ANDTEYGLSAAVFGKDAAAALDVARRIKSGICRSLCLVRRGPPRLPLLRRR
ncbi:aldehyde dehydrogenase family protein, partial [Streptomyces sp. NPDC058457]|uniref:aldehyde dehydrogenase family protein n=1 Tax=Streptomyces sp. NPDC058457 TaxID=3346507 RepID=UPI00364FFACB